MDRRVLPRITPIAPLKAKVRTFFTARVVDISLSGIQVELAHSLPPRATCDLRFQTGDEEHALRGTVRRCQVWGAGPDEQEHKVLFYRAGIEFDEPSRQILASLSDQLLGKDVLRNDNPADGKVSIQLEGPDTERRRGPGNGKR